MKQSTVRFFPVLTFAIIVLPTSLGLAQTSTSQANQSQISAAKIVLHNKIKSIRQQVLASNTKLNAAETTLLSQLATLKKSETHMSPEDRITLHEKWSSHEDQVRAEAIKIDPSVAPYF